MTKKQIDEALAKWLTEHDAYGFSYSVSLSVGGTITDLPARPPATGYETKVIEPQPLRIIKERGGSTVEFPLFTESLDSMALIQNAMSTGEFWRYWQEVRDLMLCERITNPNVSPLPLEARCLSIPPSCRAEAACKALGLWIEDAL